MCPVYRRLPVYFVVSCSASMSGDPIEAIRMGIRALINDLQGDPQALETVALSVIAFAREADQLVPLIPVGEFSEPKLKAASEDERSLGAALALLEERMLQEVNWPTPETKGDWKPKVFLWMDGPATDAWHEAADSFRKSCRADVIVCVCGSGLDESDLERLDAPFVRMNDTSPGTLGSLMQWVTLPVEASGKKGTDEPPSVDGMRCMTTEGRVFEASDEAIREDHGRTVHQCADNTNVVVLYKEYGSTTPDRIDWLISLHPGEDARLPSDLSVFFYTWPLQRVTDPRPGYVARRIPSQFSFAEGRFAGKEKTGEWYASSKLLAMLPDQEKGTENDMLGICLTLARAVQYLHGRNVILSDLCTRNLVVDPHLRKCLYCSWSDLAQKGSWPSEVLGTPGYIAPEVVATQHLPLDDPNRRLPSNTTDLHALSVLVYWFLLRRHPLRGPKVHGSTAEEDERLSMGEKALFVEDSHDTSNRPTKGRGLELHITCDAFGVRMEQMFRKAFETGLHDPPSRPTAGEWSDALQEVLTERESPEPPPGDVLITP